MDRVSRAAKTGNKSCKRRNGIVNQELVQTRFKGGNCSGG